MEFTMIRDGELGAPVGDVAQEAVDATATTYTRSPEIDVEEVLRRELHSRGLAPDTDASLQELATAIRSGHDVRIGRHDGSIE